MIEDRDQDGRPRLELRLMLSTTEAEELVMALALVSKNRTTGTPLAARQRAMRLGEDVGAQLEPQVGANPGWFHRWRSLPQYIVVKQQTAAATEYRE